MLRNISCCEWLNYADDFRNSFELTFCRIPRDKSIPRGYYITSNQLGSWTWRWKVQRTRKVVGRNFAGTESITNAKVEHRERRDTYLWNNQLTKGPFSKMRIVDAHFATENNREMKTETQKSHCGHFGRCCLCLIKLCTLSSFTAFEEFEYLWFWVGLKILRLPYGQHLAHAHSDVIGTVATEVMISVTQDWWNCNGYPYARHILAKSPNRDPMKIKLKTQLSGWSMVINTMKDHGNSG